MKTILFIFCLVIFTSKVSATPISTFQKLVETNHYWTQQPDVSPANIASFDGDDRAYIKYHLQLVEQVLRQRSTQYLSPSQQANRMRALNELNAYWKSEAFPINDQYAYRTPIFIDPYDNFCAVGHLLKATGFESIARSISKENNLVYVKDITNRDLLNWAITYGFKKEELAWIQPGYAGPTTREMNTVGGGVDGHVNVLFPDTTLSIMYVGGQFNYINGQQAANSIGYFKRLGANQYQFGNLGAGVDGTVHSILPYQQRLVIGSEFTSSDTTPLYNVAQWDGKEWQAMGCLDGTVLSLLEFNGDLYAARQFRKCGGDTTYYALAKWVNDDWFIIDSIKGKINKLTRFGDVLMMGGYFRLNRTPCIALSWHPQNGYIHHPWTNNAEISAFHVREDTLYAGLTALNADSGHAIILHMVKDSAYWQPFKVFNHYNFPKSITSYNGKPISIKTLTILNTHTSGVLALHFWGSFIYTRLSSQYYPNASNHLVNGSDLMYLHPPHEQILIADDVVNCHAILDGRLYLGGHFYASGISKGLGESDIYNPTLGIEPSNAQQLTLYPNPLEGDHLYLNPPSSDAIRYKLYSITGQLIDEQTNWQYQNNIQVGNLSLGMYRIEIENERGQLFSQIIIKK